MPPWRMLRCGTRGMLGLELVRLRDDRATVQVEYVLHATLRAHSRTSEGFVEVRLVLCLLFVCALG